MSPRQNHIQVTRGDLSPWHVPSPFCQGLWSQGRPAIGLFTDLSQVHVTREDGPMAVRHFVTATCRMNSNWFEFMWQVVALNCIKTHITRGFSRGQVASCDRTFRMSMLWFVYLTVTSHIQYTFLSLCRWKWTKHENTWSLPFSYYKEMAADSYQACKALILRVLFNWKKLIELSEAQFYTKHKDGCFVWRLINDRLMCHYLRQPFKKLHLKGLNTDISNTYKGICFYLWYDLLCTETTLFSEKLVQTHSTFTYNC